MAMPTADFMIAFIKNTRHRLFPSRAWPTRCEISCRKGLWSVTAPTELEAYREALHYFRQYYGDGEYSDPSKED